MPYFSDTPPEESQTGQWGSILAMLASDKPGAVMAQNAENRRAEIEQWRRMNSPQARLEMELKQRQLQDIGDNNELQKAQLASIDSRAANSLESENARAAATLAEQSRHNTVGEGLDQGQLAERIRADKAGTGVQYAQLHQGDEHFGRQLDATKALHDADNLADLEQARLRATTGRNGGLTANAEMTVRHQLQEELKGTLDVVPSIDTITRLLAKYKDSPDKPGLGFLDSNSDDSTVLGWAARNLGKKIGGKKGPEWDADTREMITAKRGLDAFSMHELSGSAHSAQEELKNALRVGVGGMTEQGAMTAIAAARKAAQMDVQGKAAGRERYVKEALKPYGWDNLIIDPNEDSSAPADAQTQPDPMANMPGFRRVR